MLPRTPEPELMDEHEQARAYAEADFEQAHELIADAIDACLGPLPDGARVLDVGCGPADVLARLAARRPTLRFVGVDGAGEMLAFARRRIVGLEDRVTLVQGVLPELTLDGPFDALVSNSLLHHLHDPSGLWTVVKRHVRPGGAVSLTDLRRPDSLEGLDALVARYGEGPLVLQRDFRASLHAAFTLDEVRAQLAEAGLPLSVDAPSDRHLRVWGRLPG